MKAASRWAAVVASADGGRVRFCYVRATREAAVDALCDWLVADDSVRPDGAAATADSLSMTRAEVRDALMSLPPDDTIMLFSSGLDLCQVVATDVDAPEDR